MKLENLIGECTAYDFKSMLEEKRDLIDVKVVYLPIIKNSFYENIAYGRLAFGTDIF